MDVNRLAPWYRWIEYAAFGRALERSRFVFLHRLAEARRVLVFGEGDGRALQQLLTIAPSAQFDVIESSAAMIALAREQIGDSGGVRFLCQDARTASLPDTEYDAVVTFFFLDCLTEPELRELLKRIEPKLAPQAIWLVSDFAIPQVTWQRWHAQVWIWTMYRFFRVTTALRAVTLPPIERLLSDLGMRCTDVHRQRWGLIVSEAFIYQPETRCTAHE